MKNVVLAVVFVLGSVVGAQAQTPVIITPQSTLNATPGSDYNATLLDGTAAVNAVKVKYCLTAAPTNCLPTVTISPKPALVGGEIVVANIINSIQPNASYTAQLFASGPGGDSVGSNSTLPFGNAVLTAPQPFSNARIVK